MSKTYDLVEASDEPELHDPAHPSATVHQLMQSEPHPGDEERLAFLVNEHGSTFCLQSAASNGRIDMIKSLVETYGADIRAETSLLSDKRPGELVRHNLLDNALGNYAYSPLANRTAAGIERLNQTIEYFLQQGLSANLNPHPFESAVANAFILAQPESDLVRHITWVPSMSEHTNHKPLALILEYQPEAVTALNRAFGIAEGRLLSSFTDSVRGFLARTPIIGKLIADKTDVPRLGNE